MRLLSLFLASSVCFVLGAYDGAFAQTPLPSFPLYCQGPLQTGPPAQPTLTPYTWASQGAGAANPAPGQCVWADRGPRPGEMVGGDGNSICDWSGSFSNLGAGQFLEVGVYRDPAVNNCMHLTHYIGIVSPPFSAVPALPPFVRQSIATLSATQIASLRHGIQVMMSRQTTDPTSYRFQANIHGTYDTTTTSQESQAWDQCEHGSFYFFSWHRMYLYFFDRILRTASGDPTLVLPYWNWGDPSQRSLPSAFWQPSDSTNSLYIAPPGRPTALDNGTAQLDAGTVDFSNAFGYTNFESANGSGLSFGGQEASAMQFNFPHGELESQPHDVVHGALGGLMDDPDTAAQDPIFWLHHANIDRLWNRWLQQGGGRQDPLNDSAWMNTTFEFFDEAGHAVDLTGSQIIDTVGELNYRYDDDPTTMAQFHPVQFHPTPVSPRLILKTLATSQAGAARIQLSGEPVSVSVPLPENAVSQLRAFIEHKVENKIILQLNDIQYERARGIYYEIYIDPPKGEKVNFHSPYYVGSLSFFALKPHSMAGHPVAPRSSVFTEYDISKQVRDLSARGAWNPKEMSVILVPRGLVRRNGEPLPLPAGIAGTLGRVTIATQ